MAMILDAFVGRYIDKLSEFIEGEMCMLLGVKDDLKKLQSKMEWISGFLESAQRKRHVDPNIYIWVRKLKDIMYDADDIIDLCKIEGRKLLEDHPSKSTVRHPLSLFSCFSCIKFRHEIGSKIRELNDKLKETLENGSILPKLENTRQDVHQNGVNHRQTVPMEVKSDIVGTQVEEATQSLVESLIKEDDKKNRVLGIVGMGGIGKTTLARHIYNDERIKKNFPIKIWVCVSQDFSEIKLLKKIIRSAGGNYGEAETKAELMPLLSSILTERFFIVLDDVWRMEVWKDLLRDPLENAIANGRIVVTTRLIDVATIMRANVHHVNKMDIDSGWKMLRNKVFRDDDDEEKIFSLKEIGIKIIEKCDGLPLAIKTIAGVLELKEKSRLEWNKVLKSDAWSMSQLQEELPGALFLSYEDLPSNLKQCFLYCSLYAEDSSIFREDLIHYWVTEGFVKERHGDIIMEDLAEDYYRELIRRNLLQLYEDDLDDRWCRLHDLLRSLALFLTKDESAFLGERQPLNINPLIKLRRLSMVNTGEEVEIPNVIEQQKCLRTLMLQNNPKTRMIKNELPERWPLPRFINDAQLERFPLLRVITINNAQLESLPDSVGNLLHLRHLDLDRTEIKVLPESIGCLINLQILKLQGCQFLRTLPKAIMKLHNLRCLRLGETPLTHVPKGIGKLKHLNDLQGFVVGHDDKGAQDEEGCDLDELRSLSQLRYLHIDRLDRAHAEGASTLANSSFLKILILKYVKDNQEEAIQRICKTCDELSPSSTLQRLEMNRFFGTRFPSWMMSPSLGISFPDLIEIRLLDCESCLQLPPLGLLPQLKSLIISGAHAIKTIGPEFLGPRASSAAAAFPKLEVLQFQRMHDWEEWSFDVVERVGEERRGNIKLLPHLRILKLYHCPKLRALPKALRHATSLQKIFIGGADNLTEINNLPSLTDKLWISSSPMLERVSNLPSLKYLEIFHCPRLQHVENLEKLQRLNLTVSETSTTNDDGQSTQCLPEWLLGLLGGQHQNASAALHNLRTFELSCGRALLKTFLKDGPNWPIIQWIPEVTVEAFVSRHRSYIQYTKDPPTFETNVEESEESE